MTRKIAITLGLLALVVAAGALFLLRGTGGASRTQAAEREEADGNGEEFERGPHGGRLLRDGSRAVEITIFEENVPPRFQVYVFERDKPVAPKGVRLTITLTRLGGGEERFVLIPESDSLKATETVEEPHSFDVAVEAIIGGKTSTWSYPSYEGRTKIGEDAAQAAGLKTEVAGPARIRTTEILTGRIVLNPNRRADVRARFTGVVREVRKMLGETVKRGETLALVEGNDSLQIYPVVSPMDGVILSRNTNVGNVAGEEPLFVVADLSEVWAEFHVFPRDLRIIRAGSDVRVSAIEGELSAEGKISSLLPTTDLASQTVVARLPLENADGRWRPGTSVRGEVTVAERDVLIAVKTSALQRFRDFPTVAFEKVGNTYEVRMLDTGARDATWVEVRSGLRAGARYVAQNSFLVKADIEKSGAAHDH